MAGMATQAGQTGQTDARFFESLICSRSVVPKEFLVALDTPGPAGASPLVVACTLGKTELVKALLKAKADPNLEALQFNDAVKQQEKKSRTPLMSACEFGFLDLAYLLIQSKANINKGKASNQATPLSIAAQEGHHETVRLLCSLNADLNQASVMIFSSKIIHHSFHNRQRQMLVQLL
eukprot:m.26146 g.26146  ORF g.26146 m.26146 type:complete len:178 (+) comp7772_c0_seq1:135-668(+)